MPALTVVHQGREVGQYRWDKDRALLGRDAAADVDLSALADAKVSRSHACVERVGARYEIRDVGAKNPITVNGTVVTRHVLTDGDRIGLGDTTFVFAAEAGGAQPPKGAADAAAAAQPLADRASPIETAAASEPAADFAPIQLESLRLSQRRLLLLYELTRQFYRSAGVAELLQSVLKTVLRLTAGTRAMAALFEDDSARREPSLVVSEGLDISGGRARWPVSTHIITRVARDGESVLTGDAPADPEFAHVGSIQGLQIRSVLCCPLLRGGRPAGFIYADNPLEARAFGLDEVDLVRALSLHVEAALAMAESRQTMLARNAQLRRENQALAGARGAKPIVAGKGPAMAQVLQRVDDVAALPTAAQVAVLIVGETGTGKELIAREIHARSARRDGPFVAVNCAAIPSNLVESELFGIEAGVATGVAARAGWFEAAEGGVIFLDEIGDMDQAAQAKLLRVAQERTISRVGARKESKRIDVWLVAATNKDLPAEVVAGRFRQDLYYRLNVMEVRLPPLRERGAANTRELAMFFMDRYAREFGKSLTAIDPDAMEAMTAHKWPGNVRELENTIAGCVAFCRSATLGLTDLPPAVRTAGHSDAEDAAGERLASLEEVERAHLLRTLRRTGWNISRAAESLGIGRQAVYQKIEKYGLKDTDAAV